MPNASGRFVHGELISAHELNTTTDLGAGSASGAESWSVVDFHAHRSGPLLAFTTKVERVGTVISVRSDGDLDNELVAILPLECRGSIGWSQSVCSVHVGRRCAGFYDATTGGVHLASVEPAAGDISIGEEITLGGVVLLD
ncbi:MAG: hypothetical protein AAGD33_12885 [Actinomycetota bacterium]